MKEVYILFRRENIGTHKIVHMIFGNSDDADAQLRSLTLNGDNQHHYFIETHMVH